MNGNKSKHPAFGISKAVLEWAHSGKVPLSVAIESAFSLAKSLVNDGLPITTPRSNTTDEDKKKIRTLMEKIRMPNSDPIKLLATELQAIWVNKPKLQQPNTEEKKENSKKQFKQTAKKNSHTPTVIIKKYRKIDEKKD